MAKQGQTITQTQKQEQRLSPQQIQLMGILQMPLAELEQRIKKEIEDNPALEENTENQEFENEGTEFGESGNDNDNDNDNDSDNDNDNGNVNEYDEEEKEESLIDKNEEFDFDDYYRDDDVDDYDCHTQVSNRSSDDEDYETPISNEISFQELLSQQLGYQNLNEEQLTLCNYIIGNLDDNGYCSREVSEIVDDLLFNQNIETTEEDVLKMLKIVQQLDPPGVGARNLQECLLIQLERLQEEHPETDYSLAISLIRDYFDDFSKKHFDKIAKRLDVSKKQLKDAFDEILKLNPKPGDASGIARIGHYITPDMFVSVKDGKVDLSLDSRNMPELRVSMDYLEMQKTYSKNKEASQFIKEKIDMAKTFIGLVNQRQQTLYITMKAIIEMQKEFFLTGDETKLKPMILKDIAEKVGHDISTISRVANSKHVQTPYGTFLLKYFFSEGIQNAEGEEVSTREIKRILQDSVDEEDKQKPMTDEQLMELLKEKGYPIARRTVAKYREQLKIPVGRMRKKI